MNSILIIVQIIVFGLLAVFIIPQWRLRRAIRQVIRIFREHNAIGIKNACTIDELRLRPRGMMEGIWKGRDYKKYALDALMKSGIIQATGDGRFYISEDKLISSGLDRGTLYSR